jgi:thiamine pyrophosphate-dependent acetolactate synthase large subunit-like protein
MGAGSLATVAAKRPRRFVHLCFDNERHASTGGQRTSSAVVPLERLAEAAGYAFAARATDESGFRAALERAFATDGPAFVLVKVKPGGLPPGTARVEITPEAMTDRVRRVLTGGAA